MNRREFLRTAGAAATMTALPNPASAAGERPNILLILVDDMGAECLGSYGGTSYRTPNTDQLAATGLRFRHAYAQPLCTPTRLQLMTGQYNIRNWKAFGIMDPDQRTFGHMMREAGYKTAIAGKWQFYSYNPPDFEPEWRGKGMLPEQAGFDEYCLWHVHHTEDKGSRYAEPTIYQNGKFLENTKGKYGPDIYADFLMDFMERHQREPFFLYYPMALTHGPFNPTPNSATWKSGNRLEGNIKYFGDMVEYMDVIVGKLVAKLDDLKLREKTLILYFSDNGSPQGVVSMMNGKPIAGGKGLPTNAGTWVPLIANWKGTTPAGKVTDDLVDSTDFVPTMADVSGAKPPVQPVDGVSFAPQLKGKRGNPREWVFVHHDPRPGWDKEKYTKADRFARDRRFKLYEEGQLYDISKDPLEKHPIPEGEGGAEAQKARKTLRAVLDRLKP